MADLHSVTVVQTLMKDLKATEGGWLYSLKATFRPEESHLHQVLDRRFTFIKWNSRCMECFKFSYYMLIHVRCPDAILDKLQRVVAVLMGMLKGEFEKDVIEKWHL